LISEITIDETTLRGTRHLLLFLIHRSLLKIWELFCGTNQTTAVKSRNHLKNLEHDYNFEYIDIRKTGREEGVDC